jgi:hypothetical protein
VGFYSCAKRQEDTGPGQHALNRKGQCARTFAKAKRKELPPRCVSPSSRSAKRSRAFAFKFQSTLMTIYMIHKLTNCACGTECLLPSPFSFPPSPPKRSNHPFFSPQSSRVYLSSGQMSKTQKLLSTYMYLYIKSGSSNVFTFLPIPSPPVTFFKDQEEQQLPATGS